MRCTRCGADTVVKYTKAAGEGFVVERRRWCFNGHRFSTFEVDDSMAETLRKFALRPGRIGGLVARAARWSRDASIAARAQAGEKHASIASDFGLSDNMVSTIARRFGLAGKKGKK